MKPLLTLILIVFITACFITACSDKPSDKTKNTHPNTGTEKISGERIKGPANIYKKINGKPSFSLNDNVLVMTTPTKKNWLIVGLFVNLTQKQFDDFKILPGENLVSRNGEIIGKALDTVEIRMGSGKSGLIGAHIQESNIKPQSIPERCLAELIDQKKLSKNELQDFISNFNFEESTNGDLPELTQWFIYESSLVDMSPKDRITLLFKAEQLIGIIHSRPMRTMNYKTHELIPGYELTITAELPADEIKSIIERRVKFYNSGD